MTTLTLPATSPLSIAVCTGPTPATFWVRLLSMAQHRQDGAATPAKVQRRSPGTGDPRASAAGRREGAAWQTGTRPEKQRRGEGSLTQQLVGTRLRVNVSPDLQFNSYLQYDNESDSFGTNTRVRWTFNPAGDLFVVYNRNLRALDPLTRDRQLRLTSNQLLVKLQ